MAIKNWTDAEDQQIVTMRQQGMEFHHIGQSLGRSGASVGGRFRRLAVSTSSPPPTSPAMQQPTVRAASLEMENAALRKQLETKSRRPDIEPLWCGDVKVDEMWKHAEEDSLQRIEKAKNQGRFKCKLPSNRVIGISFVSDQHIAPGTPVDFKRMREDAELISETPDLYACLNGDGVDNHIKHFAAVMAARSQPGDQWILYEHYLQILAESLLVVTAGNHDLWSNQYAGIDMVSKIAKANKLCYAPYEARVECQLGSQTYRVALRHQYRLNSSFNQTHSVKQWLRLGDEEFDIGCIGHHHEAAVEQTMYRGKDVWLCRPGAYQITSAYSSQYGWNDAVPTCPTFLLFPDKRKIVGLANVHDAPVLLKAFNG